MTRVERAQSRAMVQRNRRGAKDQQLQAGTQFREDAGVRMTTDAYNAYQKGEAGYGKAYDKIKGKLDTANKSLTTAEKKAKSGLEGLYGEAKKNYTAVNVWDTGNKKIEGTYYMPKEAVEAMDKQTFNQGDGSFVGKFANGAYNINVVPQGGDDAYGKELHTSLGQAETEIKNKFFKAAAPQFEKGLKSLRSSRDIVQGEYESLYGNKAERERQKAAYVEDSATRRKKRGAALSGAMK